MKAQKTRKSLPNARVSRSICLSICSSDPRHRTKQTSPRCLDTFSVKLQGAKSTLSLRSDDIQRHCWLSVRVVATKVPLLDGEPKGYNTQTPRRAGAGGHMTCLCDSSQAASHRRTGSSELGRTPCSSWTSRESHRPRCSDRHPAGPKHLVRTKHTETSWNRVEHRTSTNESMTCDPGHTDKHGPASSHPRRAERERGFVFYGSLGPVLGVTSTGRKTTCVFFSSRRHFQR